MDNTMCSLDLEFSDQIAQLLVPPSPQPVKDYYSDVIKGRDCCGLERKVVNLEKLIFFYCGLVAGAYATKEYKEEELILKDHISVASQHGFNKMDCLVCSYCFRYIGSIELQIGRKLYLHGLKSFTELDDAENFSDISEEDCELMQTDAQESSFPNHCERAHSSTSGELKLSSDSINQSVLECLMNGTLTLPYSKHFSLAPVVSCFGGCEEEHYCSERCAKSDWETFHSLLCTGDRSESPRKEVLIKFMEHANRTNDIFILAAKVISYTILKYKILKDAHLKEKQQSNGLSGIDFPHFPLILEAWRPTSMGYKKRWWDCVALPSDIDQINEYSFRKQIKDLAFESLQLLKEAIFDRECAPLFSLEIYGHIIGMFELNNLDLIVASPVEDYFIHIDDLPLTEKLEAEKLTRPFLDALGDDYADCCEGTAFFPLQSCMNHSCCPNAKAFKRDEDRDGQAVILAICPIAKGEEITISYIDETLPYEERRAQLADCGFRCQCSKCLEEGRQLLVQT